MQDRPAPDLDSIQGAKVSSEIEFFETLIIGSGFSELLAAIGLKKNRSDFVLLERSAELGGTWRDNSYLWRRGGYPDCFVLYLLYSLQV